MKSRRVIETEAWTDSGQQVNAAGGPDEDEGPRTNASNPKIVPDKSP
jgi:hypothetical protein